MTQPVAYREWLSKFGGGWRYFDEHDGLPAGFRLPNGMVDPRFEPLYASRTAIPQANAEPIGFIAEDTLKNLLDPEWQEKSGTPERIWTVDNPPSRAILPVYADASAIPRATPKPTHWMDDRGLVVSDDWLQNDPGSTSDYRAAYNIPCVKKRGKVVPIPQAAPLPRKTHMLALSIRQPWAWLIVHAGKDIENRDWPTRVRGRILVHAAKGMTHDEWSSAWTFAHGSGASSKAVEAGLMRQNIQRGGFVGTVEIVDCVQASQSRWFMGAYGFVLRNPEPMPFVPWKGQLGFFDVTDEQLQAARQVAEAA